MLLLKPSKLALELKASGKYPPDTQFLDVRKGSKGQFRALSSNVVIIAHHTIIVELPIKSYDKSADDDKYILFSTDENQSFYQELTIKDNKLPYGDKIRIEFIDTPPELNYSLKVDLGADGDPYFVFEDIPYKYLIEGKQ